MKPISFRTRAAVAAAALVVVVAAEWSAFDVPEFLNRMRALPRLASIPAWQARLDGSALGFDRRFGLFVEGVRRRTPPDATIALFAPEADAYHFAAAYLLAPRRVVGPEGFEQAQYAALFGSRAAPGIPVDGIPYGSLGRRP